MKQVLKYPITFANSRFSIAMPKYAKVLSVLAEEDRPVVYAEVQDRAHEETEVRMFVALYTGYMFDLDGAKFLGTVRTIDGLVYHVYEIAYDGLAYHVYEIA